MKPKPSATKGMDSRIPTTSRQIPTRITKAKTQLAMKSSTGLKRKNENAAPAPKLTKIVKNLPENEVKEMVANLTKPATTLAKSKPVVANRQPLSTRSRTGIDLNGAKGVANKTLVSRVVATGGAATNKTATTNGGAKAPAPKRIPPYDFKARFHDLLEKHQVLKAKHEKIREELGEMADLPERYDQTKEELENARAKIDSLEEERDGYVMKNDSLVATLTETREALHVLQEKCPKLEEEVRELKKENKELLAKNTELTEKNEELKQKTSEMSNELNECAEQLFQANYERKDLHNTVS